MANRAETIVIGGGITGLCAAHYLTARQGSEAVLLLESSTQCGGYARTVEEDGILWDSGPNGFLDREPLMLDWVRDLGLADRLVQANEAAAHRFIMKKDRLIEIKPPPMFMFSSLLSLKGRARIVCEPFIGQRRDPDPETIWDFAARRIGKESADMLVSAMVLGVFGGDAKKLSLRHCFPRMFEMESQHGGLVKAMLAKRKSRKGGGPSGPGGVLTSFDRGVGTLADVAAEKLAPQIRFNQCVKTIEADQDGYTILTKSQQRYHCRSLVLAVPPSVAADITQTFDPEMSRALRRIESASITVIGTAFNKEQIKGGADGFGFLVPPKEGRRILGCIWTSSVFPHTAPADQIVLRTMIGGYNDPEAATLDDDHLMGILKKELFPVMGIEGEPTRLRIFRHQQAIPQYLTNHQEILDSLDEGEARHPGMALAGAGYRGVSLNDCVVSAHRALKTLGMN